MSQQRDQQRPTRAQSAKQGAVRGAEPNASTGSHAYAHRRHGAAWLPWAILGLLALLAIAIWALAQAADDDDDATSGDVSTSVVVTAPGAATGATAAPGGAAATSVPVPGDAGAGGAPAAPGAAGGGGSLTANGQDLFAVAATPGGLAGFAGAEATGAVRVESVVSDEGFWVGASPEQRVFVFLTPEARGNDGESPFQVAAGQMVNVTGPVATVDQTVVAGLDAADGIEQLTTQGHYVRATGIQLAG
jgi:hypothetical protein